MATLVLALAGSAIGGSLAGGSTAAVAFGLSAAQLGGLAGGTIGAFLDTRLLAPRQELSGPRAGDQDVMSGQEGSPMAWGFGPRYPVGCTAIWASDTIEEKDTQKVGKGGGGSRVTSYNYYRDLALAIQDTQNLPNGRINRVVKVFADTKLIYDGFTEFTDYYDDITIYRGDQTEPDPLMVSYDGEDDTPNYKNTAYLVIHRLRLSHFGNRVPNIRVIVEQAPSLTLQEGLGFLFDRAGVSEDDYDVSRLDQCIKGMVLSGPQSIARAVGSLALVFNLNFQERDGTIWVIPKGREDVMVVDEADLGAGDYGEDSVEVLPMVTSVSDDSELPTEVTVVFNDVDADVEQGSRTARRWTDKPQNRSVLDLPVTLSRPEAEQIAAKYLWSVLVENKRVQFSLPPRYLALREGMACRVPNVGGRTREIWIRRVESGANHRIEAEGTIYDPEVYNQPLNPDDFSRSVENYVPPDTTFYLADLPILQTAHEGKIGLYYAVCASAAADQWRGAQLWSAATRDGTFVDQRSVGREATIGQTVDGVLSPNAQPHRWDMASELVVEVLESGLETASVEQVMAGANRLAVQTADGDWEIVAFVQAELVSTRVYRLTQFMRGLRGTERLISRHTDIGRPCILGEIGPIGFIERNQGTAEWWKAPALGGQVAAYPAKQFAVTGLTMRPFSPCALQGEWDYSTGDLTISWRRRCKYIRSLFRAKPLPPDESPERYEVDIIQGNHPDLGQVVRTVLVEGETSLLYDYTTQGDDGLSNKPVAVAVYQMSNLYGRGSGAFEIFYR